MSSSSKAFSSLQPFDELLSSIPIFRSSSSSSSIDHESNSSPTSFRTASAPPIADPELFLGDDCDASYEATLMNSGLLDWLNQSSTSANEDTSSSFHHPHSTTSQERLEMLMHHLADRKGKQKSI